MSQFFGVARHEFSMSIRRPGMWIAYGLLFLFYSATLLLPSTDGSADAIAAGEIWSEAGRLAFTYNLFMPLLAGILAADRMQRDYRTNVRELQCSTPLPVSVYILAKYTGVLASALSPALFLVLLVGFLATIFGIAPLGFFGALLVAFVVIVAPAHAFVIAFSLACPLLMPVRVFQVLFTGYWFWGNFLSPEAFPTISGTVLNAAGMYSLQAFFGVHFGPPGEADYGFTQPEAALNLLVLAACIAAVIFTLNRYLRWQERQA